MVQLSEASTSIKIQIAGHHARLDAMHERIVAPILSTVPHSFALDGDGGCQTQRKCEQHFSMQDGEIVFSAGLVPLLKHQLEKGGHNVQVIDRTCYSHLRIADKSILDDSKLTGAERIFLTSLSECPRGQILLDRPSETGRWIALFATQFQRSNILVVAKNRHEVKRLATEIARYTDRPVTTNQREAWSHRPRMLVIIVNIGQKT